MPPQGSSEEYAGGCERECAVHADTASRRAVARRLGKAHRSDRLARTAATVGTPELALVECAEGREAEYLGQRIRAVELLVTVLVVDSGRLGRMRHNCSLRSRHVTCRL